MARDRTNRERPLEAGDVVYLERRHGVFTLLGRYPGIPGRWIVDPPYHLPGHRCELVDESDIVRAHDLED
jgi:hypothetical protein